MAATKTYTATLLTLWLLVDEVERSGASSTDLRSWPRRTGRPTSTGSRWWSGHYRFVDKLVLTGRGYAYPTAREAALKLMETSYLAAHAFSGADLLHGPLAMVDSERPVLAVVPHGVAGACDGPCAGTDCAIRGADLTVVGDAESAGQEPADYPPAGGRGAQPAPSRSSPCSGWRTRWPIARHEDPDAPRGLSKVTRTT